MSDILPKHSIFRRDLLNYQGAIGNTGVYVRSGSLSTIVGSTTGSITASFDALSVKVKRVEVFHSGAAAYFNFSIEKKTPNVGAAFDPRDVVVSYCDVPGGASFADGIDQVEDLVTMTDTGSGMGNLYLNFMPHGAGNNDFKYLIYCEAMFVYVNQDGGWNG